MFNTGTATGPAIAGLTYAMFGPAWCFTINALSFIGVIIALRKMKLPDVVIKTSKLSSFEQLKEGIVYVARHSVIRTIVFMVGIVSVFGISFATLLPAWAVNILGGNATTNGLLQSARGVGALTSALFIASLGRFSFKGRLLTIGSILFPVLMFVFAFTNWLPFSLIVLLGMGASLILTFNIANALVQTLVPDNLRGRVMAVYTFTFFGFIPLGALLMGTLAEHFGEPSAVMTGAVITLTVAILIFIFVPAIRKLA
jgi:MFS family permease